MTTIRRVGTSCQISGVPEDVFLPFAEKHLIYSYRHYDFQANRFTVQQHRLYEKNNNGTFTMLDGFRPALVEYLKSKQMEPSITGYFPDIRIDEARLARFTFRPLQRECIDALLQAVRQKHGGLISAPCAFGKSYLLAAFCMALPDAKIDIVSRRRDVVLGNYNTLASFFGTVGLVTTGRRKKDRITVYTSGSLGYSDFSADIICLDEVHELVTDRVLEKLVKYRGYCFGFSATPFTRFDNLHTRLLGLCGPVLYTADYNQCVQANLVVPIVVLWQRCDTPEGIFARYDSVIMLKRYGIWRNERRNQAIADVARRYYEAGNQVMILVETVEHVLQLKKLLPEFEVCYAASSLERRRYKDIEYMPISSAIRERLRQRFLAGELRGVIATNIWSVGVSFNNLQVLIRADGVGSATAAIQAPGRVCRLGDAKDYGLVIDFEDRFDSRLRQKAVLKSKIYKKQGWWQITADKRVIYPDGESVCAVSTSENGT